jgi:5-formyltetrahydrofolate cyclo-ligase
MSLEKSGLRQHFAALRESMTPKERADADAAIRDRLSAWSVFEDAPAVAAFVAFGAEPELSPLATGKSWFLPRWSPSEERYEIVGVGDLGRDLVRGRFGIPEPRPELPALPEDSWRDLLFLVPALACDRFGVRLGRGGGYYDRMLETSVRGAVAVIYDRQFSGDALPREAHDRRVDWAVTENRLVDCGKV